MRDPKRAVEEQLELERVRPDPRPFGDVLVGHHHAIGQLLPGDLSGLRWDEVVEETRKSRHREMGRERFGVARVGRTERQVAVAADIERAVARPVQGNLLSAAERDLGPIVVGEQQHGSTAGIAGEGGRRLAARLVGVRRTVRSERQRLVRDVEVSPEELLREVVVGLVLGRERMARAAIVVRRDVARRVGGVDDVEILRQGRESRERDVVAGRQSAGARRLVEYPARGAKPDLDTRRLVREERDVGRRAVAGLRLDIRDDRPRTVDQRGVLQHGRRSRAVGSVVVGGRGGLAVRHVEDPIAYHDGSGLGVDRSAEHARTHRDFAHREGFVVAPRRHHAHPEGCAARQIAVGDREPERIVALVDAAVETDGRSTAGVRAEVALDEITRHARPRRRADDPVARPDRQMRDAKRAVEEQLELERVRAGRGVLGHVLVGHDHAVGQLLPGDLSARRGIEILEEPRKPPHRKMRRERCGVARVGRAERQVAVAADIERAVARPVQGNLLSAGERDLDRSVVGERNDRSAAGIRGEPGRRLAARRVGICRTVRSERQRLVCDVEIGGREVLCEVVELVGCGKGIASAAIVVRRDIARLIGRFDRIEVLRRGRQA